MNIMTDTKLQNHVTKQNKNFMPSTVLLYIIV